MKPSLLLTLSTPLSLAIPLILPPALFKLPTEFLRTTAALLHKPATPFHAPVAPPHIPTVPVHLPAVPAHNPVVPPHIPANEGHIPAAPVHIPAEEPHAPATPVRVSAEEKNNVKAPAITKVPQATKAPDEPTTIGPIRLPHTSKPAHPAGTPSIRNDFTNFGCKDIIFVYARGSTEGGNMGASDSVGSRTALGLISAFGMKHVGVEGVKYDAKIRTNLRKGNADPEGISNMRNIITKAARKCPKSIIVAGGYSQGAAIVHGAIGALSPSVSSKIAGVVTFGDTRNEQDDGVIPNFPPPKTLILCNDGDWTCKGRIYMITPAHLHYGRRVPEAVVFLVERIKMAQRAARH
ncbi:hypothetical protein HYFRA_00002438 [Hymenoscyphus fraxineus]|uniref:Cutinase n=1 Tax=Hymenoscyphus fraxineus TaxID=746836 RepID=A0A9N9L9C6_9HELO|nr:hypothetical protein HYFRA_00002438 [Hymenoscyphus fraxineus]